MPDTGAETTKIQKSDNTKRVDGEERIVSKIKTRRISTSRGEKEFPQITKHGSLATSSEREKYIGMPGFTYHLICLEPQDPSVSKGTNQAIYTAFVRCIDKKSFSEPQSGRRAGTIYLEFASEEASRET